MAESYAPPTNNEAWNDNQITDVMARLLDPQHLDGVRASLAQQEMDPTYEGRYVAGQLLGAMESNPTSLALRSSDIAASDVMQGIKAAPLLTERYLMQAQELELNSDWAHKISIQSFEDDPPLELPLANFVGADQLQSWTEGRGSDVAKIEDNGRGNIARSSRATIEEYASRTTEAKPLDSVVGYVQPNGKVLFITAQGTHRTAAAVARGDQTIKTTNLALVPLNQNYVA